MAIGGNCPKKKSTAHISPIRDENSDHDAMHNQQNDDTTVDDIGDVISQDVQSSENDYEHTEENPRTKAKGNAKQNANEQKKNVLKYFEQAEEYLQTFIRQTLGESDSKVFDSLSKYGRIVKYDQDETIIEKGDDCKGLFILIEGTVNIMTSDNREIISTLVPGDIVGDLSTVFDIPCTANVKANRGSTMVALDEANAQDLFQDKMKDIDIIDWCIKRRYLPTSDVIDSARAYRRMAFRFLKALPLFGEMSDNVIKQLVLSFEHSLVTHYPNKSIMVMEGDPMTSLYVIFRGTVEVRRGPRLITTIHVSCDTEPFAFGELGILLEGQVSAVTIQAVKACQIIHVRMESISKILSMFPYIESAFLKRAKSINKMLKSMGHLYTKYESDLQIEVLGEFLKCSALYEAKTRTDLRAKIMSGSFQEFPDAANVLLEIEKDRYEAVLVIRGDVDVKSNDNRLLKENDNNAKDGTSQANTTYRIDGDDEPDKNLVALDKDNETDEQLTDTVLADGSVFEISSTTMPLSLIAKSPCLVLKILRGNLQEEESTIHDELSDGALEFV